MAEVAMIASGAGTVLQAMGAVQEGEAKANAAEFNANMDDQNAAASQAQSAEEERRLRVTAKKQIGSARANYGASGVSIDGSALDVLEESASNAELDALTVRHQGQLRTQAFQNDAVLNRYGAKNARISGYINASGVLLNSGAKAAAGSGGAAGGGGGGSGAAAAAKTSGSSSGMTRTG